MSMSMSMVPPMLDDFLIRAVLAGLGVALAAGPLGCFVVWRRMAYFGDTVAHASILGVALALGFSMSPIVGVLVTAAAVAVTITIMTGRSWAADTLLGVTAHGGLALGLVAVSLTAGRAIDIESLLFGEILSVTANDLFVIWGGGALVLAVLIWRWRSMLTATLSPDLAYAEGVDPKREQLVLTLAIALVVAVALQVVGALLITAMLIIPAAAARVLARTPEAMAIISAAVGAVAVLSGLKLSYQFDTPTGPTIVAAATGLFAVSALIRSVRWR
jgi:zinc transport system permease protein